MLSSRLRISSASFLPSVSRMEVYAARASSSTARMSAAMASRSSSALVTVSTSGRRARSETSILPFTREVPPTAVRRAMASR